MAKKSGKRGQGGKYDVISVGSATVDCFVSVPFDLDQIKHGSKSLINEIKLLTGGGGTNVAVGLSRLGLRTGIVCEVGDDLSAHIIKNELAKEGVDFLVKQHSRHQTAYSVIIEAKGKDRAILTYKGASSFLHRDELPKHRLRADWFYFGSLMGASFDTMKYLAGFAKRNGISIYFNPSSYMVKQGQGFLKGVISATDVIAMNKEEAQMLLKSRSKRTDELLRGLHRLGPGICVITDGSRGVYVYDGKRFYSRRPRKVKAVDTTGAGDAFGTGFLAGLIMKKESTAEKRILFAIDFGMADAASVVMYAGTKAGLLRRKEALKRVGG
ncbi:carbohydrate kinase family protein [Candidatus Woesearchaeota archaeon]|nr:carbohydrate kinase family protein [Candidatus Woesearchaeota archaeon]